MNEVQLSFSTIARTWSPIFFDVSEDGAYCVVNPNRTLIELCVAQNVPNAVAESMLDKLFTRLNADKRTCVVGEVELHAEVSGAFYRSDPSCSYEGDEHLPTAVFKLIEDGRDCDEWLQDIVNVLKYEDKSVLGMTDEELAAYDKCLEPIAEFINDDIGNYEGDDVL
jgi:hypothetical protein